MATIPPDDIGSADALDTTQHFFVNQAGLLKQDTLASLIELIQSNILVPVANGGTGGTTAAEARTNLGLGTAAVLDTGTTSGTVLQLSSEIGITDGVASPGALWITSNIVDYQTPIRVDKATNEAGGVGLEVSVYAGAAALFSTTAGNPIQISSGSKGVLVAADMSFVFHDGTHQLSMNMPTFSRDTSLTYPQADGELAVCQGATVGLYGGSGSPEGVVTAPLGSLYTNQSGSTGTTLYVKESGSNEYGWTAK